MPFVIINAVLAIVSIVAGLFLYHELETTRATLRLVEHQVLAADDYIEIVKVRCNHMTAERNAAVQGFIDQHKQLQKFRDILTRHRIEWHEEPGIVLEIAP